MLKTSCSGDIFRLVHFIQSEFYPQPCRVPIDEVISCVDVKVKCSCMVFDKV